MTTSGYKKSLSVLGSTGSIGRNVLKIVKMFPDRFSVAALCAKNSVPLLAEQVRAFSPEIAVVYDGKSADELRARLDPGVSVRILCGPDGYEAAASLPEADMVVTAVVGAAGLGPTLAAIEAGKDIALANKETLVMAGEIVMARAAEKKIAILPVDSEHSAVFQCMEGLKKEHVERIVLTASGGPFLDRDAAFLKKASVADALNHPTWSMGRKISIDSATLMNKGLEVIEAMHLFGFPVGRIQVLIHPESIVHSMVALRDGAMLAQLGVPDMTGAIAHALAYPERLDIGQPLPDLGKLGALTFRDPDFSRFPCLSLAFQAAERGGAFPAVLNAANETAVEAFLDQRIGFTDIARVVEKALESHDGKERPDLDDIIAADRDARKRAALLIRETPGQGAR